MKVWIVTASPYHDNDTILGVYDDETRANVVAQTHALRMGELHSFRDECVRRGCSFGPLQGSDMYLLRAEAILIQEFEVE